MRSSIFPLTLAVALMLICFTATKSRAQTLEFDKMVHDFGDIMLKSGKHTHTFTFKNISTQPVVIQTVISSCGCTTPEWTKSPVLPGKTGTLKVTFLNDQGPYPFDKSLTVYITGEARPRVLRIKGVVHDKPKSLKELFPESFGGLSLRSAIIDLDNVAQGDVKYELVEVANTSSKEIQVGFTNASKGLSFELSPSKIAPGSKAQLKVTLNTNEDLNWGDTEYSSTVIVNGKEFPSKRLRVFASIRDNFSALTKEQTDNAPLPMANSSSFDYGKVKAGTQVTTTFKIRNLGRRDLLIHKIDTGDKKISAKNPSKIAPGETGVIEVKIDTSQEAGEKGHILSLITNSPSRPVINLIITGNVVK
ncbi:MAG: hypothetical protein CVU13_06760 [Bacteroidetes bacterium HGW-Bacteroidetes-8]|jgi:hypothetical protein|nr:MAG: hypothetical protein CVU13_06760 [Bacteroidetes bacterium HGW-Bacteroidetes-8]